MNIKTKGLFKVLVIALSMLFAVALALGISGAWYNTTREANGTLSMANGIVIDYSGFNQGADVWEDNVSFNLFASQNGMLPGQSVALYNTKIKANASSIDFYARAKLEYKFFTDVEGLTEVTSQIADYSAFINTPTFAQGWVDGRNGDGWFYYATGTTFNTIPSADYVDIFTENQSLTLNIDAPGFNHQGGGYQYSNEILIKRITVTLTLNALQANASAAEFNGWEIVPLVQNSNSQVVEIYSNQITLGNVGGAYKLGTGEVGSLAYDTTTLGTTLKIVVAGDSQINANAFDGSDLENIYVGDADYIAGVSSYSARIYTTPATITIGVNAFSSTNLNLYLSSSCNYNIYVSSLAGVGNVYYDGVLRNDLKSPAVGAVANTTITVLETPSIVTGGSGSGTVSHVVSIGGDYYTFTDQDGNVWYFVLGSVAYVDNPDQEHLYTVGTGGDYATVVKCELANTNVNQTLTIPSFVSRNELTGNNIAVKTVADGIYATINVFTDINPYVSSVIIPNTVTYISGNAFRNCTAIQTVTFEGGGTRDTFDIGGAFDGCSSLATVNFTGDWTEINITIGSNAFHNCASLTSVTIPSSVTSIGGSAFDGCTSLSSFSGGSSKYQVSADGKLLIEVNGNSQEIIYVAKSGLSGDYTGIPNSVTSIGSYAFYKCTGLTSVTIPSSVTSIGEGAFDNCSGLTEVTIPSSVTSIGGSAFSGCTQLATVIFEGGGTRDAFDIEDWAFVNCSSLATVNFTGDWTGINITIGDYAFRSCPIEGNVQLPSQS